MRGAFASIPPDCVQPAPWASRSSDRWLRPSSRLAVRRPLATQNAGSAREVAPPSEFDHRMPPRLIARVHGSFLDSRPLQRSWERGSHVRYAGLATTRLRSAFRVSHPLDGLTPPRTLPACFIRLTLLGLWPSRAFLLARSRCASRRPLPSCRSPREWPQPLHALSTRPDHGPSGLPARLPTGAGPSARLHGFAPLTSPPLRCVWFRHVAGA